MEDYDSCVSISDDDDNEYIPLVTLTRELLPPRKFPKFFPCYFCKTLKFKSEEDVDRHIQRHHQNRINCKDYSFRRRKCRLCKTVLRSYSFLGLISHVVEKKCQIRLAEKEAEKRNKEQFLNALSLCSVSTLSEQGQHKQPLRDQRNCALKQQLRITKRSPHSIKKVNHKSQPQVKVNARGSEKPGQNWIYGAPLPEIDPACDPAKFIPNYKGIIGPERKPPQESSKPAICTSFLCGLRDEGVVEPCSDCKLTMSQQSSQNSLQVPQPLSKKPKKWSHTQCKPKQIFNDQITDSTAEADERAWALNLYVKGISASRKCAREANLKICSKTMRKVKRFKRRDEKIERMRRASNAENDGEGPPRGKFVLRVGKELWLKVLAEQSNTQQIQIQPNKF